MTAIQLKLLKDIRCKGWREQESQYLFPSLYGSKAVTKRTRGLYKHMKRVIKFPILKYL